MFACVSDEACEGVMYSVSSKNGPPWYHGPASTAKIGAVAQLGERCVRNAEVGSSILLRSTNYTQQTTNRAMRGFLL